MDLQDYLDKAENVGMGALETMGAPFEAVGETIRGAGESEPLKMATAANPSGFRWPSIVQRLAPSTRTPEPPAEMFTKAYQGLEGLANLPRGVQAASDVVTGRPDLAAQLGGMGLGLGVLPPVAGKMATAELPQALANERGALTLGAGSERPAQAASPWFSRIENALQDKLPPNPDVGQVKNILSTLPQEEQQWRGLDKFLSDKFGQVSKADIMEHLKQNPVELGEMVLGDKGPIAEFNAYRQELKNKYDTGMLGGKLTPEETDKWNSLNDKVWHAENRMEPKFEQHSTPGGENYREVLMTLPLSKGSLPEGFKTYQSPNGSWGVEFPSGTKLDGWPSESAAINSQRHQPGHPTFQSSHFDEPNVLAHIRMKDFTDPVTGKKTLLVDEIQSDWHQKGRQKGYQEPGLSESEKEEMRKFSNKWMNKETLTPEEDARWEELTTRNQQDTSRVPNAPFKKNWHELAFKRALKEAVEGGYDEMAWTTGDQQAARYDLSKQLDTVNWEAPMGRRDRYIVSAVKNGKEVIPAGSYSADELSDVVGKELAEKIIDQQASGKLGGNFSGLDLKVGGEGMKGFYDDILPAYANKYLKKYGVKVGNTRLDIGEAPAHPSATQLLKEQAGRNTFHSIPITPEMKADILRKGQPMWQVPAAIGAGAAGVAAGAEGSEQKYAEGGIVQKESDMPFQSQAQRAFMYAKHPKIAERFQEETPKNAKLPEHVKKMNKGGIAGDWKDDLAGYMNQHFGDRSNRVQHLYDGGTAGSSDGQYDVDLGDTSTARGIPSAPPSDNFTPSLSKDALFGAPPPLFQGAPAASGPVQGPVFNPQNGLPPPQAAASVVKPSAPTGPNPLLQGYLQQRREGLDKYGPDAQMALEQQLQKQRTGFLPNLALAGTGLADAIMQGVARAGSSNFQSNLENRMDKTAEGQRQAFEKAQTGNLAKMKQEMELDSMDPSSVLSKSAQRANMRTLKGLGYSDAEASQIPASMMPEALTRRLTLEEINQKGELAKATLGMTGAYQNAELAIRRAEANRAAEKEKFEQAEKIKGRQNEAAKEVLGRDKTVKAHILGSDIPVWSSPVSRVERRQAREVQRQNMAPAGSQFASEADAEAAGLAPGTVITINGRPARVR